jgi:hypothetical protein
MRVRGERGTGLEPARGVSFCEYAFIGCGKARPPVAGDRERRLKSFG